jgi:hypothetical protein
VEAVTTVGAGTVLYLYGFVRPSADLSRVAEAGAVVFLVEFGDVACAVSAVPAVDYHLPPDASTASQQLEWVTPRAWRHHEVLRLVHSSGPIVPLKFGTLCADAMHVHSLLQRLRDPVVGLLAHFEGKDEWTLRMRADVEALSLAVQASRPDLIALKDEADRLPDGHAYFARKHLQKATADIVTATLARTEHSVYERFSAAGIEMAPVDPPQQSGSRDSSVIANAPLLVERARFAELEAVLAQLEGEHVEAHLAFELIGPWPPYSFATSVDLTGARECQQ